MSAAEADLGRPASRGRATVWLLVAIAAMAAFFLGSYRDALGTFFYLDDYWVLAKGAQIAVRSPLDVAHFFVPTQGFFFYRPVSTVMYFHVLHALFGTDPFGFHAVHLGAHVVNGLLVYAVADRLFFSRPLALATALVYAAAPGHAFAAYWVALFTVTGTALFYFLGLWVWLAVDGRGRVPLTFALFVVALLASEHAVSFPLALTLATLLTEPRAGWRRIVREQAPFYALLAAYLAGKVYEVDFLVSRMPPPDARAYVWTHYHMSFAPGSVLTTFGRYLAFGLGPLYAPTRPDAAALVLGALVVALAVVAAVCVLRGWWSARPLRVAAYGLGLFLVALGPVAVLPEHVYSSYVGLAMLGLALAVVGFAAAVPRAPGTMVAALVTVLLAVHAGSALPRVRQSNELTHYHAFSDQAARWLYTLAQLPPGVEEVVVPNDHVTGTIFRLGDAQQWFLCAPYRVRVVPSIGLEGPAPGRVVITVPVPALPAACRGWSCVRRDCGAG